MRTIDGEGQLYFFVNQYINLHARTLGLRINNKRRIKETEFSSISSLVINARAKRSHAYVKLKQKTYENKNYRFSLQNVVQPPLVTFSDWPAKVYFRADPRKRNTELLLCSIISNNLFRLRPMSG